MNTEKPWYLSKTIWGALVAVGASLATLGGLSIDTQTQAQLPDILVQLMGAAGALLAIYGRLAATETIS